jgi:tungstate transport system substrate-binding protein
MRNLSPLGQYLMIAMVVLAFWGPPAVSHGEQILMMATTTSTDNTGLLDYLAPHFTKETGIELRWTSTGTGKALALGRSCDVDVLLVHAPEAEIDFVNAGYGVERHPIMYNDFILIGPPEDPAGIKGKSMAESLAAIAARQAVFVSRGDNSGTHIKELELWSAAKLAVPEKAPWYIQTGQGMLVTINIAVERQGYTLTDRGTFITFAAPHQGRPPMVIVAQGDEMLRNPYSVIVVNPEKCPKVKGDLAGRFAAWMAGSQGQALIGEFQLMNQQLFFPDAR